MNVYEIFTKISMQNAVSGVLATIAKEVLSLEGGIKNLSKELENLRGKLAIGGGLAVFGGLAGLDVVRKTAEHGAKLLNMQDQLQRGGLAYADVLKLQTNYFSQIAKAIPTSTAAEYLKTIRELRSVTGSQAGAVALAPRALMADALLSNTLGGDQSGAFYKLMRSDEMKGITTNPAKLAQLTEMAFSYITAFGGKLTPQDFQTFARRAGTAWINMKPEAFGPAAIAMADLGGSAAGTAMMTLQQLQQGTMTLSRQQAQTLEKAGLLDMSKVTKTGFGGGRYQLEPGAILGSLKYMGDLPGWVKDVVYPHMMAAAGGNEALFQNMLGKEAPNRNAAKMIEMFGDKGFRTQISKDLNLAKQVETIEKAYQDYINRNPMGAQAAFSNQFESMLQAIGSPMMIAAIPVLKFMTSMFTSIGEFADTNPEAMQAIGIGFASLSAALIGVGGVMILSALGPAGWLAAGIIGLGAAVLRYHNPIAAWLENIRKTNWNELIIKSLEKAIQAIKDWFVNLGSAIMDSLRGMWEDMKKGIGGLFHLNYEGGGIGGGGIIPISFGGGGGGGGTGVFYGGSGTGGTSTGGSGLGHPLSGGGIGGAGGGGGMSNIPIGSPGSNPILQAIHRAAAGDTNVERIMRNIYAGESGHGSHWDIGDHGDSGGPFQLDVAGGRLGAVFQRTHPGMSVFDPRTLQAQADFVANYIKTHPHSDFSKTWFGLQHPGRFGHLTGGYAPGTKDIAPYRKPEHAHGPIHNVMYLDGEPIHRSIVKRMVRGMTHPTTAPYHDGSRHWTPPDAGLVGV